MKPLSLDLEPRAIPAVTPSPPMQLDGGGPPRDKVVGVAVALIALGISVFWGANIVALKVGLEAFPPFWGAFWRMGIGAIIIGLWARGEGVRLTPERNEWGPLTILAVLCFAQISLLNHSVNLTSAAYAVVLINAHPIFTNVLAHYFIPGDLISGMRLVGLLLAFAGILFIFLGKPDARLATLPYWGNVLAVISAFFVAVRSVTTKRVVQRVDATRAIFWTLVISEPLFLAMAYVFEPPTVAPITWMPVAAIVYQGVIVAGFCFILWTRLLRDYPPGIISVFAFPTPLFGVLFSAMVYAEHLPRSFIVGAAAVIAGIIIVARHQPRPAAEPQFSDQSQPAERAA